MSVPLEVIVVDIKNARAGERNIAQWVIEVRFNVIASIWIEERLKNHKLCMSQGATEG